MLFMGFIKSAEANEGQDSNLLSRGREPLQSLITSTAGETLAPAWGPAALTCQ